MSLSVASDAADSRAERGVPVICGPTAAGKSEIALQLAAASGRPVLVADSRQVYRRFDLGTAKPTADERRRVHHFGIDVVDPTDRYSAAQWATLAENTLTTRPDALVVGGTGLYLRAFFEGLFAEPALDPARRADLLKWLDTQETDELRRWTAQLDPDRAHLGRTQLLRALELALLTGVPISTLHSTLGPHPSFLPRYLVIDPGPALQHRIADRFDAMIASGWLDEVRALRSLPDEAPAWKASGYRALREVVDGRFSLEHARELVIVETRQYAKRQRTWFRHQLPPERTTRINPLDPGAEKEIERWWTSLSGA